MTVAEWTRIAESRLRIVGIESARLESQMLASHVLRVERSWLFAHPDHEFNDLAGEMLLQRREAREPLAYLLGHREFFGRDFRVTPDVLIPRQETETLVESALQHSGIRSVLDIGTGSGAIAITLKLERPEWQVTAVDISPAAIAVAEQNADRLGTAVTFLLSDLFEAVPDQSFDLIVTNPPYIAHDEPLMPEVGVHEPALALFGGNTGLEFYERLAQESGPHLVPGGLLLAEVGYQQAEPVCNLFAAHGWNVIETIPDLTGVDRVVITTPPPRSA